MRRVDQTTFGSPGGNCFSACVASMFELSIDDVPYFMGDESDGDEWCHRFEKWLCPRGLYPVLLGIDPDPPKDDHKNAWRPQGLYILSGKSPRDTGENKDDPLLHSVLARGHRLIHDPHPSRDYLVDERDVCLLIALEPKMTVVQQTPYLIMGDK